MKSQSHILCLAISLMAVAWVGCGHKPLPQDQPETAAEVAAAASDVVSLEAAQVTRLGITTTQASRQVISGKVLANGILDVPPQNLVSISAPFGGFLQSTPLLQGSRVNRGQQIALLQDPEFVTMQQQYLEDRSQYAYLASEYERQTILANENVNARKTLERAKADFESMKARLAGERAKLEMLNIDMKRLDNGEIIKTAPIFAPITGFVTQVNVNIGSHVRPEDILFKIADTGHLHAELTVYEQDLPMLGIGQKVRLRISNETHWRNGTIHLLGREVGADRSVKVHVHLDEEDTELVPGTFLTAEIATGSAATMALPNAAIVQFEGKNNIFIEEESDAQHHQYRMMNLEIGRSDSGFTEVILPPSFDLATRIVLHGSYNLLAKLKNTESEE